MYIFVVVVVVFFFVSFLICFVVVFYRKCPKILSRENGKSSYSQKFAKVAMCVGAHRT